MAVLTQAGRRSTIRSRGRSGRTGRRFEAEATEQLALEPPVAGASAAMVPADPGVASPDRADELDADAPQARTAHPRPHGGLTLDDLVVGVWEDLSVGEEADCPVCRSGALAPVPAGGRQGGRTIVGCTTCGSQLA